MIKIYDLAKINALHSADILAAVNRVAGSGWYIRGEETARFEAEYASYTGTRYCVGCGNGLDALTLILRAYVELGVMAEGDEVIVPANTYIASILAITRNRLKPVLVEPRIDTLQIDDSLIEHCITPRTRAVMIVHMYGRCAYTDRIGDICKRYNLKLVEDNAQAHGCEYNGRKTGALGSAAGHSFYPTKNLGALGDAGAVTTDDGDLAECVRALANYGSARKYVFDYVGVNSRMDEIQAAVLSAKLKYLDADNAVRRHNAAYYMKHVSNPFVTLPTTDFYYNSVFHIFPLLSTERDRLRAYLAENGVQTDIHYPVPPHKQRCYGMFGDMSLPVTERIHAEELSFPVNPAISMQELATVTRLINDFK